MDLAVSSILAERRKKVAVYSTCVTGRHASIWATTRPWNLKISFKPLQNIAILDPGIGSWPGFMSLRAPGSD
jgi:hypothetical protein